MPVIFNLHNLSIKFTPLMRTLIHFFGPTFIIICPGLSQLRTTLLVFHEIAASEGEKKDKTQTENCKAVHTNPYHSNLNSILL